jgi:4-hydroxy-tetrahydrodipicolinate synthase
MTANGSGLGDSIVPLVTPLTATEDLDERSLRRLIAFHAAHGTQGIMVLGTCGEGAGLRGCVKERLLECALEAAGELPVLAAISETASRRAAEGVRRLPKGIAGILLMPPTFLFATAEREHVDHVERAVDAWGAPVVLYNLPSRTGGHAIPPAAIRCLLERGAVNGIKESSGNMSYLGEVLALRRDFPAFRVMNGDLAKAGEALLLGAQGLITSYTNVDPAGCLEQIAAARRNDRAEVERLQAKFRAVRSHFAPSTSAAAWTKAVLAALGLCDPRCCAPTEVPAPVLPEALAAYRQSSA